MMSVPPDSAEGISNPEPDRSEPAPPFDIGPDRPVPESVSMMREELRALFPKDAKIVDRKMMRDHETDTLWTFWFTDFADRTRLAFQSGDEVTAVAHMTYMSEKLEGADADARYAIGVDYVENFLDGLSLKNQRWAWTLIPQNLKDLYVAFWGEITPRKMARIKQPL